MTLQGWIQKVKVWDRDRLFIHSVIFLFFNNLASLVNAAYQVVMGRTLSREEYGILLTMLGVTWIVATPTMALQTTIAHFTAHLRAAGRTGDIRVLVRHWALKVGVIGGVILAIALAGHTWLAGYFNLASAWPLAVTLPALFLTCIGPVYGGALQGLQSFFWLGVVGQVWGAVRLVLGAALVLLVAPLALNGLAAQLAGTAATLLISMLVLHKVLPALPASGTPLEGSNRYFFLSILGLFCFSVLMNADLILVKHYFHDEADYGNYARASTIARIMIFLSQPIAGALFPKVISRGERSKAHGATLLKAVFFAGIIIGGLLVACLALPRVLLLVVFNVPQPEAELVWLIRWVCVAMAPLALVYLLLNFEMAQQRFTFIYPLMACGIGFIGGVTVAHQSLRQVVYIFVAAACASLVAMLALMLRPHHTSAPPEVAS